MLEKLSLRFDAVEDRLRLVLHLKQDEGASQAELWITRRVAAAFQTNLTAMLALAESEPQSAYEAQAAPVRRPSPLANDAQGLRADDEPSEGKLPSSDAGPGGQQLVSRIQCARRRSDGRWMIKLQTRDAAAARSLLLSDQALKDLAGVWQRQLAKADWALPAPVARKSSAKPSAPRPLH